MYDMKLYNWYDKELPSGELIDKYRDDMREILIRLCPRLDIDEIEEGMNFGIQAGYQAGLTKTDFAVKVHNNHRNQTAEMDILSLANSILTSKPIMTTQGVLFVRHGTKKNPFYQFIQYLLDKRDEAKKEMKKYPKGSEMFNKWNLKQLNYKVSCNALYGCAGQYSSIFYNLYLCTAVTGQGRGCISASITMFEGLLSDNMKFANLTEVLQYIENIRKDTMKYPVVDDLQIIDRNVAVEQCLLRMIRNCGWNNWVPGDEAVKAIWKTICNLDQRTINRLYYKNNLYEFCNNSKVTGIILGMLVALEKPYLDPNKVPDEIKDFMTLFYNLIEEWCYYRHIWIDKLERVYNMTRDSVLITDTDSCIVSLDEWYKFVLAKTVGIHMRIKYTQAELKEAAEKAEIQWRKTEPQFEYDFYNDKLVEAKRKKYPMLIIEEDNLRYSIVNILAHVVSKLILDYMVLFSENYNTKTEGRECLLIMKNEFLFRSLLLKEKGKKNYATIQLVQEGNIVPEDKQLDIKGLPITKVGMPESTKSALKDIIEYDILRNSFVDQVDIFKKFTILEKQIYESLKNKSKEYHKPARIKSKSNYEQPMRIQGIKGAVAYNMIRSKEEEEIDLNERNTVLIIKVNIDKKNIDKIVESYPEHYLRMQKVLELPEFKGSIDSIAIPFDKDIPDWIIPFIDYNTIIQDNLRAFPLESVGMSKMESKYVTHTNIIKF